MTPAARNVCDRTTHVNRAYLMTVSTRALALSLLLAPAMASADDGAPCTSPVGITPDDPQHYSVFDDRPQYVGAHSDSYKEIDAGVFQAESCRDDSLCVQSEEIEVHLVCLGGEWSPHAIIAWYHYGFDPEAWTYERTRIANDSCHPIRWLIGNPGADQTWTYHRRTFGDVCGGEGQPPCVTRTYESIACDGNSPVQIIDTFSTKWLVVPCLDEAADGVPLDPECRPVEPG